MSESVHVLFGLLAGLENENWLTRKTEVEVEGAAVAIARDPHGRAAILVPAAGKAAGSRFESKGLVAKVGALGKPGQMKDWLMVTCLAPHLESTFFVLCDDVLIHLAGLPEGSDPVAETIVVVERWHALMAQMGSALLSVEKYTGLLAELNTMEALIAEVGTTAAFKAWAGPDRARIDFRFDGWGIEVKATTGRDRLKVTIHGLLQLDEVEVGDLRLFAQQLEQVPFGGDSVPDVVERLVGAGVPEPELRTALGRAGYHTANEDVYRKLRFKVLAERGCLVGPSTPRIVAGSFVDSGTADAVSSVSYTLDLTDLTVAQGRTEDPRSVLIEAAP